MTTLPSSLEIDETFRALLAVTRELADGDSSYLAMLRERFLPAVPLNQPSFVAVRETFDRQAAEFTNSAIFAANRPVADTLRDIALGELDRAIFVELGATSVSAFVVESDPVGTPTIRPECVDQEAWRTLVPGLPASAVEQAVALASGATSAGVSRRAIETQVQDLLRRLGVNQFPKRARVILFQSLFGWRIHALVATALAGFVGGPSVIECPVPLGPPASTGLLLRDQLDQAIADAPLRYEYALLTASIDPMNQVVSVESFPLFYRETSRLYGATKDVQILAPQSIRESLQLAIVARVGSRLVESVLITGASAALPAGQVCKLWVQLDGPGRVSFPDPPIPLAALTDNLSTIFASVPPKMNGLHAASLDLVCLLDLIGDAAAVNARIASIGSLVECLQGHYQVAGSLKIGLLACSDTIHVQAEVDSAPRVRPVQKLELGNPGALPRFLANLEAFDHPARDFPAALDTAIAGLRDFRWRANSQHSVFTVAGHPPHPPSQGHHRLLPNQDGLDWTKLLGDARQQLELRSVLAIDRPTWPRPLSAAVERYLAQSWETLGFTYRSELGSAGVEVFAEEVDPSLAAGGGSLRLPLLARGATTRGTLG